MVLVSELSGACLAVRPPGPATCKVCCGGTEEPYEVCWSCGQLERALSHRLGSVVPISLTKPGTGLYAALKQYKGRPNSLALRQRTRLALLVDRFLEHHESCVSPGGYDTVVVVPSLRLPARGHPLAAVLRSVPRLEPKVREVLFAAAHRGTTPTNLVTRNRPDPRAFRCPRDLVEGSRVMLVDDLYTTGAHVHSAAMLLAEAGASSVDILVIGRHQSPEVTISRRLLEWTCRPACGWSADACVRCADPASSSPAGYVGAGCGMLWSSPQDRASRRPDDHQGR